jgi:hypothetical protein
MPHVIASRRAGWRSLRCPAGMGALRRSGGGADGRQRRVDRANADGVPGRWVLRTVDRIVSRCDVPRQRRKYQIQSFTFQRHLGAPASFDAGFACASRMRVSV